MMSNEEIEQKIAGFAKVLTSIGDAFLEQSKKFLSNNFHPAQQEAVMAEKQQTEELLKSRQKIDNLGKVVSNAKGTSLQTLNSKTQQLPAEAPKPNYYEAEAPKPLNPS
jgi:BioD-like phosphotransacetylase family protein